jgi:hypothetical protein
MALTYRAPPGDSKDMPAYFDERWRELMIYVEELESRLADLEARVFALENP